jgi:predicted transcriptional regulator
MNEVNAMTSLTIDLSEELLGKLQIMAEKYNIEPEELLVATVEELVSTPDKSFQTSMEYVLQKNHELYLRLAA